MKMLLACLLIAFSTVATAEITTKDIPACSMLEHIRQTALAKQRGDNHALRYLGKNNYCFSIPPGLNYSVIDISHGRESTDWVKLRVYKEDVAIEVYTWQGLIR